VLEHEACEEHWGLELFLQEEGGWRGHPRAAPTEAAMGHKGKSLALAVGRGGGSLSLEMGKTGLCKALWDPVSYWGQPSSEYEHDLETSQIRLGWTVAFFISWQAVTSQSVHAGQGWLEVGHFISF